MDLIPFTKSYKIRKGLELAKEFTNNRCHDYYDYYDRNRDVYFNDRNSNNYEIFRNKILQCANKGCRETEMELRNLADKVSPGLGNVDRIVGMICVIKQ